MPLKTNVCVLASTSSGNCTAIWNDEADTGSPQFALALTDLVDGYVHQLVRREATPAAAR